ncbi:MAG: hypothetical protein ACTSUP_09370, partial [Candidatus Heimdallarchaeaceae archaeon]
MSIQDRDKQKTAIEKTVQKFAALLPSVRPQPNPAKKALVLIDGTSISRTSVLAAEQLNHHFGTKIDVVCFYSENIPTEAKTSKQSYEDSLTFAYEHLRSDEFEIKGQVVESVEMLRSILDAILKEGEYDLIIVPSSFIGIT